MPNNERGSQTTNPGASERARFTRAFCSARTTTKRTRGAVDFIFKPGGIELTRDLSVRRFHSVGESSASTHLMSTSWECRPKADFPFGDNQLSLHGCWFDPDNCQRRPRRPKSRIGELVGRASLRKRFVSTVLVGDSSTQQSDVRHST
jgi:hypothetical protein